MRKNYDETEAMFGNFLVSKKDYVIKKVCEYLVLTLDKPFYEWQHDYYFPHDSSGRTVETNYKNRDKATTVTDYIEFYNGEKEASYDSGMGWNHLRIEDDIRYLLGIVIWGNQSFIESKIVDANNGLIDLFVIEFNNYLSNCFPNIDGFDNMRDFLIFNDVTGCGNMELDCAVFEFLERIDFELLQEISAFKQ